MLFSAIDSTLLPGEAQGFGKMELCAAVFSSHREECWQEKYAGINWLDASVKPHENEGDIPIHTLICPEAPVYRHF